MGWLKSTEGEPKQALRRALMELVTELMRLDQQMFEILQRISLPADVEQMWDLKVAYSVTAGLHSGLRCVKTDLVEEAISRLRKTAQSTDEELREEFRDGQRRQAEVAEAVTVSAPKQRKGGNG